MRRKTWDLHCPVCKRVYVIEWAARWRCPTNANHEPLRVEETKT